MVAGDELTWKMYEIGATCSLNQCEKTATTKRVMKYKPKEIKELAAFIAAIRPGFKSLLDGFLNRIEYTNGEKAIDDLLERLFSLHALPGSGYEDLLVARYSNEG